MIERQPVRLLLRSFNWKQFLTVWTAMLVPPGVYWLTPFWAPFGEPFVRGLITMAVYVYAAGAMCFGAFVLAWYLPFRKQSALVALPAYAAAIVVAVALHEQFAVFAYKALHLGYGPVSKALAAGPREVSILILGNMLFAGNAIALAARAHARGLALEQMERDLAQTKMMQLSVVLDPEDAFSSIREIRRTLHDNPDLATTQIARFGDRLRARLTA